MAYSLMFSLPGSPVLFYGEEIGMDDDPSLPGRMAVRTPMRWEDAAAQRRDADSLLNWFERLTRRRRESQVIGHGTHTHLPAGDPAVFAHRCDWEDRTIVAVHNLARRAAHAELALDPGDALQDLFGHRDARAGDDGRLDLDLEPHDHRWYAVERSAAEA
jgi:maltose alpha-D-glucosyltransferase/alpha-amylase